MKGPTGTVSGAEPELGHLALQEDVVLSVCCYHCLEVALKSTRGHPSLAVLQHNSFLQILPCVLKKQSAGLGPERGAPGA